MATEETVPFVAPQRPRRPRHHGMQAPYDFFYALLNLWDRRRLGDAMRVLQWALELLSPSDFDTTAWANEQHGVTPVLTPALTFLNPRAALERLADLALGDDPLLQGEEAEAALVASMRLTALVAFVRDYRVRFVVMSNVPEVHGPLQTRPPDRFVVWKFFEHGGVNIVRAYFDAMVAHDRERRAARERQGAPPVLGLGCVRSSLGGPDPGAPAAIARQRLEEMRRLLLAPLL